MERFAPPSFDARPTLALQLQSTYRDLPAEAAYLAASVSP